ncbi:hypothetical protein KIH86_28790 [Paenibacillus sp. HN-1]|uniref:hypothetical protein n=1 Tax=Paenibacillus TaxID=44249 RepID=UPI001CA96E12|nr:MULTISPECIES: hypothetical protein [Paenibacillus]MBY9077853.1 hypothetical protein [Paenibacillus sp. CGMCC 1.18879]MBY9088191.1 hypothetical protein [Paenibacillus sinensis]
MKERVNEQELIAYIVKETKAEPTAAALVLKHAHAFINGAKANAKGEVDIDSDDLVDYVLSRRDVKLDEITVENILEAEMDYLMSKGLAGYLD